MSTIESGQISLHCHFNKIIKELGTFLAQTLYTSVKSSPLKCKFLSAWVKIRQIPHVNFELTSQVLIKICIILYCHDR